MDFKTKWYSPENKPLDIPTFQNLQDVTGQAFDEFGNYVGKTEVPNQQLVIDKLTERQYYAPKEYSDDALRYAKAKVDKSFKPEDWYGMTQIKPHYKIGEHISAGYITALKSFAKPVAMLPTQLVYAGSVGLNALAKGDLQKTENLYRYSMQNWSDTLDKHGLGADPELSNMLTAKVGSIAGQTASSLLIAATVSSVGGLPAVATVFGSTQFADILEEGLEKGLPHDKAVLAAFLAAVPEGGLEAVGFKMWSGAASLNKTFRNLVLAFLWEGAQEGSQQIAESTITNLFKIREQTFFDIVADVALSALVGGLVGLGGAAISGQVEQRNIALKKEIGMTEQGNIVPQKPTDVKESVPQKEGQVLNPSPEAEKQLIQQEIEEAKKTGDNKLYNTIKYVANANDVTDVDVIDKLYPICRKMIADGGTIDTLLDILGNQIVAYKNQLQSGQAGNQATQKAVEEIKLATDPNRVDEWRESRKSELEKAGASKREARIATKNFARAISNLSNRLGFDITQKYDVSFEKRAPMSETLKGIKEREEGDISFNFGANAEEEVLTPFQEGRKTQAELLEAKRSIEQGLRAQKSAPRSTLLSLLRRVGANYSAANRIDKEAYKNVGIRNNKSGIGDELAFFLRDNGFMSFDDPQTYEDKSRLEDEAADLIDRALSGEKIYSIENQALADEVAMAEESREQAEQELRNINIDLTRGQISFLGKVAKIALGETFDFTTLEHEFFHFIDRVVLDAAKEGNVEAQKLVKKRDEIIKKAKAELKKQGVKDIPIDEEILASAYEKWLWQGGKSEDAYEQRLFNAIREFFREVYDTVKGLMGIRITPEADAYFRAMTGEGRISYQSAPDTLFQEGIKYDSNGKADINSPEFKKWFGKSKVVDENGKPLVMYHGTPNATFEEFRTPAYFTKDKEYAEGYQRQGASYLGVKQTAENPDTYAVYLSIKKPFDTRNAKAKELFYNEYYGQRGVGSDLSEKGLPDWMEAEELSEWLEESHPEYDGLIVDEGGTGGYGMPVIDRGEAYLPFSPNQIKSVYNRGTFDTESPNIYYQDDKNLAVVHKISSSSLEKAIDLGGFPVPSIGIINKNQPFNIGGDITLVGTSDIIDPSISSNEVYNRDVWSKTFPQTEYKRTTAKARDAFRKKFATYFDRTQESTSALSSMMYTAQAKNPAGVIGEFERSLAARVAYIETVQGDKVNIETKDRSLDALAQSMWNRWSFRVDEQFVKEAEEAYKIDDNKERGNAIARAVDRAFYRTDYSSFGEKADKLKKEMYQNLFEKDGSLNWNAANDIEYRIGEYLAKRGKKTVDYWELRDQLDKQIKKMDDFYEWATKTVQEDLLGEPMLRVGRTLKPFTLENVTKAMISGTTKNAAEALVFGPAKVVAAGAQRLRSIKEIKAAGKKLLTPKQASEQMDTITQEIIAFANEVAGLKQSDFHSAMTRAEDVMRALASIADKKTPTAEALQRAINYELAENDTYSKELLDAGVKIANNIRNLSRDYFEAKPQRAVSLSEFVGAIIPTSNKYDEIAKKAEDAGLQVVRSDNQIEALSSFSDTFFQSDYQQETNEQLFRNDQATKHGNRVLDKAPTNQEVEDELEIIKSGRVEKAQEAKRGLGIIEGLGDALITVRQRVGVIDKRLKYAFDKLDYNEKMMESEYGKRTLPFIKKFRKLSDVDKKVLKYLIGNQQTERIREFMREHDMTQEYNDVRGLLDELFEEGNRAGMDMGFLQEYFPTKVSDYKSFISYLMGTDKWSEIELALNQIDPNHQLSDEERADAINSILRGYNRLDPVGKKGFQKERKILHKTPEMLNYYMDVDEALMRYITGMTGALAIRKAFNVKGAFNSEESIGGVVNELIKSGQITQKEEPFIKRMIRARLNYARTAPIVSLLKNFGYLGTMNNITSAVTQIGDLYATFYKYNFPTAMKAIFGKSDITKDDLYLDSIWEEFSNDGFTSVAVNKLFAAIGLNAFDKFGKNTAINGAWIDLKERAKNNDVSLLEDLSAAFGSQAGKVLADIKANNITSEVKLMLWSQLADTQPIGKSGTPVGYLSNGYTRIFYQLKTYTINQLSLFYADGLYKIQKGIATKNKKLFLQGTGNLMKLALLLTVFNAGADVLKNLIMGRSIEISDTLVSNLIWNLGVSKYTFYRGQRDGYARALFENFLPPQISMADEAYKDAKKIATGKKEVSDTIAVTYVPFGRMWYWWFGGGRTSEKKKGNKPFQVKL